jgi:8-hydroxy-5-deazaflavin:NADPH oxidoreductase
MPAGMTTIGLIGSGKIGSTVASLAVDAGHRAVLSNSRGPETLAGLVAELGPQASAATSQEAAAEGDIVVKAYPRLPAAPLTGKVVIDTGNYYPQRDGRVPELDDKTLTDSEYLLGLIPGARLVKAFNNIYFKHLMNLARPAGAPDRSCLPVAGDDVQAKAAVTEFLDSIGYDVIDAGPLAGSWRQQRRTPVYTTPYGSFNDEKGTPAGTDVIRTALAAACQ